MFIKKHIPSLLKYNLFLAGIFLPFSIGAGTRYTFVFLFISLLNYFLNRKLSSFDFKKQPGFYLPVTLFLICTISTLLTSESSFKSLEKLLILAAIPLVIFINQNEYRRQSIQIFIYKGFVIGNVLSGIINLILANLHSVKVKDGEFIFDSSVWGDTPFWYSIDHYGNYFISTHFSTFMHPSYCALYLCLSIAVLWIKNPFNGTKFLGNPYGKVLISFFFIVLIALMSSRAGILSALATLSILFAALINKLGGRHIKLAVGVIFFGLATFLSFNPRMINLIDSLKSGSYLESPRIQSWISSWEIIRENWIVGVGLPNAESTLNSTYKRLGFEENLAQSHNAHNQFLEIWMTLGIPGLLILLLFFLIGWIRCVRTKDLFFFLFLVNLAIHFSFESMLHRYHGIVLLALFYPILWLYGSEKHLKNSNVKL